MSGENWTPGPWNEDRLGRLVGSNQEQVDVWGLGCAHTTRSLKTEANAQIMRSAPKLYDALKQIVDCFGSVAGDIADAEEAAYEEQVVKEAYKVMAEARGELND